MNTKLLLTLSIAVFILAACSSGSTPAADQATKPAEPQKNVPTMAYPAMDVSTPAAQAQGSKAGYPVQASAGDAQKPSGGGGYPAPQATTDSSKQSAVGVDYKPRDGDDQLTKGNVYLDTAEVLQEEPPVLHLTGNLPTPCNELRVKMEVTGGKNEVTVQVYSLSAPDKICTQVLVPFEQKIPFEQISSGKYQVIINGKAAGELTVK